MKGPTAMTEPAAQPDADAPPPLARDRRAAITVEYALLAALLAIMAIAGTIAFGDGVASLWSGIGGEVGEALAVP